MKRESKTEARSSFTGDATVDFSGHPGEKGVDEPLSDRFGRYRVTGEMGGGTFGIVYRGRDPDLEREVAIKVPRRERIGSAEDVERYLNEARTMARLDHAGIVPVYDCGQTENGRCFVVSKSIDGPNLRDALRGRRFSPAARSPWWPTWRRPCSMPTARAPSTATSSRRTSSSTRRAGR